MKKNQATILETRKAELALLGQAVIVPILALGLLLFGLGGISP